MTAPQLAKSTGTDARYAREWLVQQAATGILEVEDEIAEPDVRRFTLPAGHAEALLDPDSLGTAALRHIRAVGRPAGRCRSPPPTDRRRRRIAGYRV